MGEQAEVHFTIEIEQHAESPTADSEPAGSTVSVSTEGLPLALSDLHRRLPIDASATLQVRDDETQQISGARTVGADYRLSDVIDGSGFIIVERPGDVARTGVVERTNTADGGSGHGGGGLHLRRAFTLADTVGPQMSMLVCGLNPSIYSAEVGVGFGRPGNRFWPAAIAAGLVAEPGDPRAALLEHSIGMTDLVKRPTRRADQLSTTEYRDGLSRVERLVAWLRPGLVCFVGLAGWRAVVDRKATAGLQPSELGGVGVYLMPSTSGLNASSRLDDLAEHLRQAKTLATAAASPPS